MKDKNKLLLMIFMLVISVLLILLPTFNNINSVSDLFKQQKLYSSILEYVLLIIGLLLFGFCLIYFAYMTDTKNKEKVDKNER